jgi:ketosteroid isomerase-like protein
MFDVPSPFLSRGLDAYMATWEAFLSWSEKPVAFDFHDVKITAGKDVAFATAIGRCAGIDPNSKRLENPTATAREDPQDGADSIRDTQAVCGFR